MKAPVTRENAPVDEILERISKGEVLLKILRDPGMPSRRSFMNWVGADAELAARYKQARDDGFDVLAEDCLDIADDGRNDYTEGKNGPAVNAEHIQRSKLRIWTRLELLKRWDPKRYGDLVKKELTGANGGPIEMTHDEWVRGLK